MRDDGWGGKIKPIADAILESFDWDKDGTGMGNLLFAACRDAGFQDPIAAAQQFAETAARNVLATNNLGRDKVCKRKVKCAPERPTS